MQEVLLFTEPSKREVWENTFNSNDFHVYAFHPLKDLINSDTAVNLIKDDKVDIAFIDITSLAKRKAENREVYLKSIQTISQEIAPDDKFSRLAFYLPEDLPADIAQLVQTAFAFKVYDFFQPKNGQFRADAINAQLHRPKSIENGTKFFTIANQAVQAQSKESPAANDNMFSSDSDDIDDDEWMDAVYEAVTGKKHHADKPAKVATGSKSEDIPGFVADDLAKPKDDEQDRNDNQQEEPVESEAGGEPLDEEEQHKQLHRIQPYEKQFDVEPKPKHKKHFLGRKKKRQAAEESPEEIAKPSGEESQEQPGEQSDFTDDFLYGDYDGDYSEEPSKPVTKKKSKKAKAGKQRSKAKKKSKKKKSKLPLILLVALAVIIIVGVGFVGTHGLSHLNFNTSTTSAPAKGSLDSLLDAGDFTKAVEDYPSKQSQIDNYILNDDNISNKGNVINQVYTNAESPNDTVVFDNAYFQKDWDTVIANKSGADLTMQRKAMLCIAYLGKGNVSEAQVYAKKVNNQELNHKVAKYKELQSTNQQIESKLKDNNLSQSDRQQLQKQLDNDKSAMKTLINN